MLWIELFDSHLDNELPNFADMKYKINVFTQEDRESKPKPEQPPTPQPARGGPDAFKIPQQPASSPFLLFVGETGHEVKKSLAQHSDKVGAHEVAAECRRRWQTMSEEEKNVSGHRLLHLIQPLTDAEMEQALRGRGRQVPRRTHPVQRL